VAVAYPLEASRSWDGCRSSRAELDGSHAVAAEARAVTHVVAEAQQDESLAVAEAPPGDFHVAEAARQGAPAEAAYCVACPDAIEAEVAAESQADGLVAQVSSAEFLAHEKAAAASSAELLGDDYSRVVPEAAPEDDCSQAVYQDIAGAAVQVADWQTADAEPTVPDDHCLAEYYDSLAEPADYQEHRAGEHYWADHQDEARSDCYQEHRDEELRRDFPDHLAEPDDSLEHSVGLDAELHHDCLDRSAGPDEVRHHDFQVRSADQDELRGHDFQVRSAGPDAELHRDFLEHSVGPDDSLEHSAGPDVVRGHDFRVRSAVLDAELHPDFLEHSVDPDDSLEHSAGPDDWLVCSAVPDAHQGQLGSDHRGLRVATAEPEPAARRGPFSPEAVPDDLLRRDPHWDGSPDGCKPPADESRLPDDSSPAAAAGIGLRERFPCNSVDSVEHS
jgi:hypothetical protein